MVIFRILAFVLGLALTVSPLFASGSGADSKAATSAASACGMLAFPNPFVSLDFSSSPFAANGRLEVPQSQFPLTAAKYLEYGSLFLPYFTHMNSPESQRSSFVLSPSRGIIDVKAGFANFCKSRRADALRELKSSGLVVLVDHNPTEIIKALGADYHSSPIMVPNAKGELTFHALESLVWDERAKVFVHSGAANRFTGKQATYNKLASGKLEFDRYREFSLEGSTLAEQQRSLDSHVPHGKAKRLQVSYLSSWIRENEMRLFNELVEAGAGHTIGVYRVSSSGQRELVAGSFLIAHRGILWSLAAVTLKKLKQELSEIQVKGMAFDTFPLQKRALVEALNDGAGIVESAATFFLAEFMGYETLDIGSAYANWGFSLYGAHNIPTAEYIEQIKKAEANVAFAPLPSFRMIPGSDITQILINRLEQQSSDAPPPATRQARPSDALDKVGKAKLSAANGVARPLVRDRVAAIVVQLGLAQDSDAAKKATAAAKSILELAVEAALVKEIQTDAAKTDAEQALKMPETVSKDSVERQLQLRPLFDAVTPAVNAAIESVAAEALAAAQAALIAP